MNNRNSEPMVLFPQEGWNCFDISGYGCQASHPQYLEALPQLLRISLEKF
ncbi:MAG: hypothetical protein Q7R34_14750 [Dehalococcoidia bacterium]|nr:hypothetical protein [Dehalococcoidia bacterium]